MRLWLRQTLSCALALGATSLAPAPLSAGPTEPPPPQSKTVVPAPPAAPPAPAHSVLEEDASRAPTASHEMHGMSAQGHIQMTVRSIAASHDGKGVDPRLGAIADTLHSFAGEFSFTRYELIDARNFELAPRGESEMSLPGARSLLLATRGVDSAGRIAIHIELLGSHPAHARRLHADYTVERGHTLLVGGLPLDPEKPEKGRLLLAITEGSAAGDP